MFKFKHYNQWIPQVIEGNGQVPIFNIMNVRGYCIAYDGKILTVVFAADIAREGGMIQDVNVSRFYRNSLNKVCATSGTNLFQGNESQLASQENETDQNFRPQVVENNTEIAREGGLLNPSVKIRATSGTKNDINFSTTSGAKIYTHTEIRWARFNEYLNNAIEIALVYIIRV